MKSTKSNSNSNRRRGNPLLILFRELATSINLFFSKPVRRYVKKIIEIALTGTDLVPTVRAAITSHDFELRYLSNVPFFKTRRDLFKACLDQAKALDDLHLQFGVYKVDSINLCAKQANPAPTIEGATRKPVGAEPLRIASQLEKAHDLLPQFRRDRFIGVQPQ
jgi:hypothetical protein